MSAADEVLAGAGVGQVKVAMSTRMIRYVQETHDLFTYGGRAYAVAKQGGRVAQRLTSAFVIRASAGHVGDSGALNSGAKDAAAVLSALADGQHRDLALRVARLGVQHLVIDLGEPNTARCISVTPDGWEVLSSPPEHVLFRRTRGTRVLEEPARGGSLDDLAELLRFGGQRWALTRGWLSASLLPNIARPMLAFMGPAGSAKTTRAWMIVSLFDPKPDEALGGTFGKNLKDDEVKAQAHFLVAYDNLGQVSEATSDHLARLVTGNTSEARALYSDDDLAIITYRRTGVFTAIALPQLQPDALERLVPIMCDRVPESERLSEADLMSQWRTVRAGVMGAVLDDLVLLLRGLPSVSTSLSRPRMADYWQALYALDPGLADAYVNSSQSVMEDAAEGDPFVTTIRDWLEQQPDKTFEGTPQDVWVSAGAWRNQHVRSGVTEGWWPTSARSFGRAISRAALPLDAVGVAVHRGRGDQRTLRLSMDGGG